jgi:hypothetical protein
MILPGQHHQPLDVIGGFISGNRCYSFIPFFPERLL